MSSRRLRAWGVALVALAVAGCGSRESAPDAPAASAAPGVGPRPNIVLLLTDDQLDAPGSMQSLRTLMFERGTAFDNSFVSVPLCCPSRATLLTGLLAHNHGVRGNALPLGGFERFRDTGLEASTLGVWLQAAGYRTGLIGKYLNRYPGDTAGSDRSYVPKGWDSWVAFFVPDLTSGAYWDYLVNEDHAVTFYPRRDEDYATDALARQALRFLDQAEQKDDQPFFLYLAPSAPHIPADPAPRHKGMFDGQRAPRVGAFDEEDMSDKPSFYRRLPRLSDAALERLDRLYRARQESLQSVDEMLEALLQRLSELGELERTWVFYTSDNGFQLGQHRFPHGKEAPYEESIRVPLVVRGPGVPAGESRAHMVLNVDLPATFVELAGARPDHPLEGRSLVPLLRANPAPEAGWRDELLLEHWRDDRDPEGLPAYTGLRTRTFKYVEYETGERELYSMEVDSFENNNLAGRADQSAVLQQLAQRLAVRRECRGEACR